MKNIFVTGIGTDIGKTIASAILVEAFGFDYWKPVQAGNLDATDSNQIQNLVTRGDFKIHPEAFRLKSALSPHIAAKLDHKIIQLADLQLPATTRNLIIEGAGGVMTPLNDNETVIDLIKKFAVEVVIVSRNYLGSINHSLLTFEVLAQHGISVLGWIFNGEDNYNTEGIIVEKTRKPALLKIAPENKMSPEIIQKYAKMVVHNGKFI